MISFDQDAFRNKSVDQAEESLATLVRLFQCQGCSVVGPYAVRSHGGKSWCYTISEPGGEKIMVQCTLFNAAWTGMSVGPRSGSPDFFRVVEGIRDARK